MIERLIFRLLHPVWRLIDAITPKRDDYWAFATHHLHTTRFIENQRALFEHVKDDPAIRKFVFYRGQSGDLDIEGGVRCEEVRLGTLRSFALLARCRVLFVTHSIAMDFSLRWGGRSFSILKLNMRRRLVINLWHGIPLKRLLYATNEVTLRHTDRMDYRYEERKHYAGLIASSDVDSYAMAAMFYPLNYTQVWLTGLPRNDFLINDEVLLPRYIRTSLEQIRRICQGRRLVIYAPTYRQVDVSPDAHYYQFTHDEIVRLKSILEANDAVLGFRPHYFRNSPDYFNMEQFIDDRLIFDMSQNKVPEFSALARECSLLITDYSSVFIETLYLGKPGICFAYDLDDYQKSQDGLLYDLDMVFPGPICRDFDALMDALAASLEPIDVAPRHLQSFQQRFFFLHHDGKNCERVRERIELMLINPTKAHRGT